MLSRVANAIFWMCRHIERTENVIRFISVNLNVLLDLQSVNCDLQQREPLAPYLKRIDDLLQDFAQRITAHYLSRVPTTPHYAGRSSGEDV